MNLDFDFKSLLETPDRSTLIGKRDFAILNLICHDRLKNGQIARINLSDFDFEQRSLQISTKSNDKINLHPKTAVALQDWLENIDHDSDSPLFFALDRSSYGHRLTGTAIYKIITKVAKSANIEHPISPERLRNKLFQDIPKSTIPILVTEIIPSKSRSVSEFDLHRAQHSILDDLLADKRSVNTKTTSVISTTSSSLTGQPAAPAKPSSKHRSANSLKNATHMTATASEAPKITMASDVVIEAVLP